MFARAPVILSVFVVSTAWTDPVLDEIEEDATIPAPQILSVQPYEDAELTGNFLLIRFSLVPDAVSYRIWREIQIIHDIGMLVGMLEGTLEEPGEIVPWARVDAPSNSPISGFVIVTTLDTGPSGWAISAIVERDGTLYRSPLSPLSYFALPTAVEAKSWGQVKHRTIAP